MLSVESPSREIAVLLDSATRYTGPERSAVAAGRIQGKNRSTAARRGTGARCSAGIDAQCRSQGLPPADAELATIGSHATVTARATSLTSQHYDDMRFDSRGAGTKSYSVGVDRLAASSLSLADGWRQAAFSGCSTVTNASVRLTCAGP